MLQICLWLINRFLHFRCLCLSIRIINEQLCTGGQRSEHQRRSQWPCKVSVRTAWSPETWQDWCEFLMLISRNRIATEKMMSMKFCKYWKKIVADSSSSLSVYSFTDCLSILSTTLQFQCTNYLCWEVSQWPYLFMCLLKIIGKEFPKNCYKTIFRKISTEEIFFPTYTHYK